MKNDNKSPKASWDESICAPSCGQGWTRRWWSTRWRGLVIVAEPPHGTVAQCDEDTRSWILMLGLEFLQVIGNSAGVQMLADSGAALAACSPQVGASVNVTQRQG